ncbi:MAG TPA: phosphoribosylanthranilate isomerase [Solirubrobacteraceae bacterium]|nr:phosphoribosylanthranilate isomerase [Solirubrobacteraceae bacterium]
MSATRVKICGVTRLEDAELAASLGAWAIGMVFYEPSPRSCAVGDAELIGAALHRRVEIAGVFVNAPLEEVVNVSERAHLTLVQLHGEEGPAYCAEVARRTGARTIKAAAVQGLYSLQDLERYHTDFHLLDGHAPGLRGGTGRAFDWSLVAARRHGAPPLIVAGGLDASSVAEAVEATSPYAVDVSSGVEAAPGVKDPERMQAFFDAAAQAAVSS